MELQIYQVDAFADKVFSGNPAAVCPLSAWLPDSTLQKIACENNLSETAFYLPMEDDTYHLRWFTPTTEVDLCGHATLATAFVMFHCRNHKKTSIRFQTRSGTLTVTRDGDFLGMDFPADPVRPVPPDSLGGALNCTILETWEGVTDILVVVEDSAVVQNLAPDFRKLSAYPNRGFIVTAPGKDYDIVSRCFYPALGIDEDPVTGAAHTTLFPFWAPRLGKSRLTARQLSPRGGTVIGEVKGKRVLLTGKAVLYMEGNIQIG